MAGQGRQTSVPIWPIVKKKSLREKKHTPESVLRETSSPSKVIDQKFKTYIIETKEGQVLSGDYPERGQRPADNSGRDRKRSRAKVALSDIEEKNRIEAGSLMPEGLLVTPRQG